MSPQLSPFYYLYTDSFLPFKDITGGGSRQKGSLINFLKAGTPVQEEEDLLSPPRLAEA
jgi:hypothetical protein